MAELKASDVDGHLRSAGKTRLYVVHGADRGLVSEIAGQIAAQSGIKLDDPFSLVRLDGADLQKDAGRLIDEVQSIGLFGGDRLVWVKATGNEKGLLEALQQLSSAGSGDSWLVVEAGDLKKTAALRKLADQSSSIVSIICYADDSKSLNQLIDSELARAGQRLTPEARLYLLDQIGGDRIASRGEIQKLMLYCQGVATIDVQHVMDIIGDASALSVDDAVDAVLKGDRDGFLHAAQKIIASKTSIGQLLRAVHRQFQQLDQLKTEMVQQGASAGSVLQSHGRMIHFRRKPAVEQALRTWTPAALERELNRLQAASLQSRQRNTIEETVVMQTLLATVLQSGRRP